MSNRTEKIKSDTEQRYILSEKKTDKVIKCQNGVRQKISRQDWNCGHCTELQKWYSTMYVSNSIQWLYNSTNAIE